MRNLYILILSTFLACITTVKLYAQSPGGVAAPDFWVKSDDAGTIATAWKDHSANANNIPAVGTWTLSTADRAHNFHPYTTGYTTSKFFYNSTSAMNPTNGELPNTNTSVFSAVRPTTANGTGRITGIDDDVTYAAEPGFSIASGKPRQYEFFNTATSTDFSTTFNTGVSNVFSAIANNTVANGGTSAIAGGEKRLGLNGSYETFSGFAAANKFQIFGRNLRVGHGTWDVNGPFPGDIMEVIWYKRTLTANEQSRVNTYLALKNGVTLAENYLASDSSIIWDRIINTGYNNNIFGIARDNTSALHQKQSGSVNTTQKLVIATTGFAQSNAANNTAVVNDLQFLIVGDNGLKQSLTTPLVYTGGANGPTNYRFEAIWKVQNTGSVGTVTIAWPKSVKNLYLVQSPDAGFDATDTFTPMTTEVTVNGVIYNTVNVTLGNGHFFTFAGFGNAPGGVTNNLSYWYRADRNATHTGAGTDVTGWTDVWNGNTVAQLGTNALPKYAVGTSSYFNFNPGINFTAVTQTLGNTSVQTVSQLGFDIFTLTKEGIGSNGSNPRIFSSLVDNNLQTGDIARWDGIGILSDNRLERVNNAYGSRYLGTPGSVTFATTIPSIMYHTFTDLNLSKGINGAANGAAGNHTARGLMNGGHAFGSTEYTIGGANNGSDNEGFLGHLGETIIYGSGNLTAEERRRVDSYIAIKYGITLGRVATDHYLASTASSTSIVWNGATNAAYNNNIFGMARADIGGFEQKVSKSVNTGTILTIAKNNNFVLPNNDASRTGLPVDEGYFLLGDNNITTTALSNITINGFTGGSRIARIWLAQRTNTIGTMYFGTDLSAYGGGFGSGDQVKMVIADDAAFTANVVAISGTYDATTGKWVHSYNFDSGNVNRYITYAAVNEIACTTGCNDNTYLNAVDPNTIEYDNLIATDIAIMAKEKDATFKIWGFKTSPNTSPTNSNLALDLLVPTAITPANGFNYTGTPLRTALTSNHAVTSSALLTTDGLYTWGSGELINNVHKNSNAGTPAFSKVTVNGKTDGLPPGVSPNNVKMMYGNPIGLAIVTCSGATWVLTGTTVSEHYGDGSTGNVANSRIWHRVQTSATQTLDNVVAVRGSNEAKLALTSDGKLYTWGLRTYIGDGTDNAAGGTTRAFATEVVIPAGITPKMIGMAGNTTYFLLATNGKLFAMGRNDYQILGDGTTTASNVWKEVTATSGSQTLGGNIAWISPGEHSDNSESFPSINVLTTDKKQWGWGSNNSYKLGQTNTTSASGYGPTYMPGNTTNADGMGLNDEIIAVETGGFFTINYKNGNTKFGFVGASAYGTIGNGSTGNASFQKYTYDTAILDLCAKTSSVTPFPCDGTAYLLKGPTTGGQLFKHNLATGATDPTPIASFGALANGLGYSPIDNTLWALVTTGPLGSSKAKLTRVDGAGVVTTFDVPNLSTALGINPTAAGVTPTGYYVAKVSAVTAGAPGAGSTAEGDNYVVIDINPSRPATYLQIVDPANSYAVATAPYYKETIGNVGMSITDFSYNPGDNLFYTVTNTGNIATLDITTGAYTIGNPITLSNGSLIPPATYNSTYIDATGALYTLDANGNTYRINISSGNAVFISNAGTIPNGDGANCNTAVLAYTVQGNVFNDSNGLNDGIVNGTPTNLGNTLNAILYNNTTGAVVAVNVVAANGTFAFGTVPGNSYTVYITTNTATVGQTAVPVLALPPGYGYTGEYNCVSTPGCTGNDGTADGILFLGVVNGNISQANFGMNGICTQPGATGTPVNFTQVGISDRSGAVGTWPANVPNGFMAIQSANKGFVITRLSTAQINSLNAVEGMLVYDTDAQCIKLYNGTAWNCIERSCNQ